MSGDAFVEVFRRGPQPSWIYDTATLAFVEVNDAAIHLYGYSRDEFLAMTIADIRSPAERERLQHHLAGAPLPRRSSGLWTHRRRDGTERFVEVSSQALHFAGRACRLVVAMDATDRVAAAQALLESEAHAHQLIESAPDAMLVADADAILQVNGHAVRMFGYRDAAELVGQPVEVLIPARFRSRHRDHRAGYLAEPSQRSMGSGRALYGLRADGSEFPVEVSLAPITRGERRLVILSVLDITERQRLELDLRAHRDHLEEIVGHRTKALEAARAEAERLARIKSVFLANMSHEIRTPLNGVIGLAHVQLRRNVHPEATDAFRRIAQAGQHLLGVINDILDISRIEAGKLQVADEPFELARAVREAAELVALAAQERGLALTVHLDAGLPATVRGDAQRLTQILGNLLGNAVKFTERGSVALEVRASGARLHFTVRDTGIGIAAAQLERLFQPFEQVDNSTTRRFGGSGLGLAISQQLARLLGGMITARSEPGRGSEFLLDLPLQACAEPQRPQATVVPAARQRLNGVRVLAVEDAEINRLVLQAQLELEAAELHFAENGAEALERVSRDGASAFDVVLMDVQMPVMDGYEASRRLRALAPALPVIGLTAHAMPEERARCLAAGMVDMVTKPVDLDRLVLAILVHRGGRAGRAGIMPPP